MVIPNIAIIGAGHMGASLIGGLINYGHPSDKLWAANPSEDKLIKLKQAFQIHTTTNNTKAVQAADVIIFAVKPLVVEKVAKELRALIQTRKPLIISIAAGVPEDKIQSWLGGHMAIVRTMPNTPALIGCGAAGLYANAYVTALQRNMAESIMRAVGVTIWLPEEELMDTVTALSGCGPAYFFLVMESLQEAAEQLGLPKDTARLLTLQTAFGAARMAMESDVSLEELRRHVTSPGGTTEKAISVLEENNIRHIFKKALQAAKLRAEELATLLGEK